MFYLSEWTWSLWGLLFFFFVIIVVFLPPHILLARLAMNDGHWCWWLIWFGRKSIDKWFSGSLMFKFADSKWIECVKAHVFPSKMGSNKTKIQQKKTHFHDTRWLNGVMVVGLVGWIQCVKHSGKKRSQATVKSGAFPPHWRFYCRLYCWCCCYRTSGPEQMTTNSSRFFLLSFTFYASLSLNVFSWTQNNQREWELVCVIPF